MKFEKGTILKFDCERSEQNLLTISNARMKVLCSGKFTRLNSGQFSSNSRLFPDGYANSRLFPEFPDISRLLPNSRHFWQTWQPCLGLSFIFQKSAKLQQFINTLFSRCITALLASFANKISTSRFNL